MKNSILFLILILLNVFCCKPSEKSKKIDYVENNIQSILSKDVLGKSVGFVIIPNAGCTGCIDQAVIFVRENINKINNVPIIFTSVKDRKLLKLTLGKSLSENKQVYFDENNILANSLLISNYPQFVKLDDGKIKEIYDNYDVNNLHQYFNYKYESQITGK